jgi:hypothetical protein
MTVGILASQMIPDDPQVIDFGYHPGAEELQLREELHLKWRPKNGGFNHRFQRPFFLWFSRPKMGCLYHQNWFSASKMMFQHHNACFTLQKWCLTMKMESNNH